MLNLIKKILYFLMFGIFSVFLLCLILILVSVFVSKYTYRRDVLLYLQDKYNQTAQIKQVHLGEYGWVAKAILPEYDIVTFSVMRGNHDDFFEQLLEYEAEEEIKKLLPEYNVSACLVEGGGKPGAAFPELYDFYKEHGRPAKWSELPYISLQYLYISSEEKTDDQEVDMILQFLDDAGWNIYQIEISDSSECRVICNGEIHSKPLTK